MNGEPISLTIALVTAVSAMAAAVGILWRRLEALHDSHRQELERQEKEHQAELDRKDAELRAVEKERLKAAEDSRTWALALQAQVIDAVGKLSTFAKAVERARGHRTSESP